MVTHRLTEAELRGVATTIFGGYIGLLVQEFTDPELADATEMVRRFMSGVRWQLGPLLGEGVLATPFTQESAPVQASGPPIDPDDEADRVPDEELGAFLGLWSEEAHARALELRELVLSVAPFAEERLIRGWKVVAYDHDGLIAYIKPRHDAVHLGFYDGVNLPDPHGHLEGSGKYRRHLVIDLTASLDRPVILELLRHAFKTS